jgi:hypothetical protein
MTAIHPRRSPIMQDKWFPTGDHVSIGESRHAEDGVLPAIRSVVVRIERLG